MKIHTYSNKVWLVGKDLKNIDPISKSGRYKVYYCDPKYVGVVYLKNEKRIDLYIGHGAPHKKVRGYILKLATSLDVENVEIKFIESISDLKEWDKLLYNINIILASGE